MSGTIAAEPPRQPKRRGREMDPRPPQKKTRATPPAWPADSVARWPLEKLLPSATNPRTHSDAQVAQIAASMEEWGWTIPVLCDETGRVIAGHGRIAAARLLGFAEVPVMIARGWTDDQKRAYLLADNKLATNAGWDEAALAAELRELNLHGYQIDLVGFSAQELESLLQPLEAAPPEEPELPELPAVATSRPGDVWRLGDHRIICGDSTHPETVALLFGEEKARAVHADPPYGMGKEADGIANDNLYGEKLDRFQLEWWNVWRAHTEPNGSGFIWGRAADLWRLWYAAGLATLEPVTLRNEIVWDNKTIAGMASDEMTQFPETTERALFFQLGRHVFLVNQTKDDFWPGWEPLRAWLAAERDKAGWSAGDVRRIVGNHMHGHWFGRSQWVFITEDNYTKLQAAANGQAFTRSYADLLAEYQQAAAIFKGEVRDPRQAAFNAGRPYFDNAHEVMRDVWEFPRVHGEERFGHATPKPVAMIERICRSLTREGEILAEPFVGTGSGLLAAERTGRRCFGAELEPLYVDVAVKRWQSLTGQIATLEATGEDFEAVYAQRKIATPDLP